MAAAYASSLFSTASSLVSRSSISSNYSIANQPPTYISVWKVERAVHNSHGKQVSIWSADKSGLKPPGIEHLKKEISLMTRLRHPCVLEVTEPVEETRHQIVFATEPISYSLRQALANADRPNHSEDEELDQIEIQKGLSQIAKGLQFLHQSAKLVHANLVPENIIINAKGDWKLSGLGRSIPLFSSDGSPTQFTFPLHDTNLPAPCQPNYDYLAPEYLLDESNPSGANDLYSLGILIHVIQTRTGPPFSNQGSLDRAKRNIEDGLARGLINTQWRNLPEQVKDVLANLITRYPSNRLTLDGFLGHSFFSNLLVNTLRFLEPDSFAAQTSETQAGFLKGLVNVLPQFNSKINRRKVLPCLLAETRVPSLVPFLLPNILYIAAKLDTDAFRAEVLPSLKPLFATKEPPQAIIALIDSIQVFHEKCTATVFREEVMPLIYNALESENPLVLERALKVIPSLSETLDYTTVKQTLFPKITTVFTKTTMLSVKVNTLICFHSMVNILDKYTLTEKLVPLLSKIKTKEPAVMVATLAVHEEMGKKCDVTTIATLILPQLWTMSIGPLLNVAQFNKFMVVITRLSQRVQEEHGKHLAELKRLEESSQSQNRALGNGGEAINFESLVRGGVQQTREIKQDLWDDLSSAPGTPNIPRAMSPPVSTSPIAFNDSFSRPAAPKVANGTSFKIPPPSSAPPTPQFTQQSSFPSPPSIQSAASRPMQSFAPLVPSNSPNPNLTARNNPVSYFGASAPSSGPNYNIVMQPSTSSVFNPQPMVPNTMKPVTNSATNSPKTGWNVVSPPGFSTGLLQPTKKPVVNNWDDLDPLK